MTWSKVKFQHEVNKNFTQASTYLKEYHEAKTQRGCGKVIEKCETETEGIDEKWRKRLLARNTKDKNLVSA